jgi:hypothetical protein
MTDHFDKSKMSGVANLYNKTVMAYPIPILVLVAALTAFFGYQAQYFTLDASSDAIVLENDSDLKYYDETREIFGSDDYVFITLKPANGDLFSQETLEPMGKMLDELAALPDVESVTSILNVPLFHSPDVPLMNLAKGFKSLVTGADPELARIEMTSSPLYKNYLINEDGTTTAMQVTFKEDPPEFKAIEKRRAELKDQRREGGLSAEETTELSDLETQYKAQYEALIAESNNNVVQVRAIVASYSDLGDLHIGGVPMIMADIISYVDSDIKLFGILVSLMVLVVLALIFRQVRWVLLPSMACILTVLFMFGYLGWTRWSATIVTSNFPSLLFVIALADTLHLVVHFRELHARHPEKPKRDLILASCRHVAVPCLYTSLTTCVGFASLIVSGIRPVMDFGIMMAMGVGLAYFMSFIFFPAALLLFTKGKAPSQELADLEKSPLTIFARLTENYGKLIFAASVIIVVIFGIGTQRLLVENRFIDYFKSDTPIYQGMSVIDRELGGTTPLEVVLEGTGKDYWIDKENLAKLKEVHEWLDALPETGKVISPHTMIEMITKVNKGNEVPIPIIKIALSQLPPEIEDAVVGPYMTTDRDQVRIAMRAMESDESLSRKDLMGKIDTYFNTADVFKEEELTPHVTGLFQLYNNLLQSLYASQIQTIGAVFGAIWVMFILLFRSIRIATIAIIPNIIPVLLVIGTLGWTGIPLDIMTTMTAAITLGIAVDFAIHYVHRFQHEFEANQNYVACMHRCNNSIGRAMFYTTLTIIAGFSLLIFSNFIPNIYFGLFTMLAIVVAFVAAVTLLPLFMIWIKPLGKESTETEVTG